MITRLTRRDAEFYALESGNNPMHIGSLAVVDNTDHALVYHRLRDLVDARLSLVPRYRQRIREVPWGLGRPVWVPDNDLDLSYHIRQVRLSESGSAAELHELVARLSSRALDRSRPLWEMYLISGIAEGRSAVFVKSHATLVDGQQSREIGHVILDDDPTPRSVAVAVTPVEHEPTDVELMADAVGQLAVHPRLAADLARQRADEALAGVAALAGSVLRVGRANPAAGPFGVAASPRRRFAAVSTPLADYRRVRQHTGASINDVILAVVAGALRQWLISRGDLVNQTAMVRACVPMSVYVDPPQAQSSESGEVTSFLIDLPIGEPNPVVRLSQIAHANEANITPRRAVGARTLVHLAGFAPTSLHAMSVRAAGVFAPQSFQLMVTNAPGPQAPMYIAGARMVAMYPVPPLLARQALSIGLTSYNGRVCYGINADHVAVPDVDVLAGLIEESMEEMLNACS